MPPPRLKLYLNRDELRATWVIAVMISLFWGIFAAFTASMFGYPDSPWPTTIAVFMLLLSKLIGEREMLAEGQESAPPRRIRSTYGPSVYLVAPKRTTHETPPIRS